MRGGVQKEFSIILGSGHSVPSDRLLLTTTPYTSSHVSTSPCGKYSWIWEAL